MKYTRCLRHIPHLFFAAALAVTGAAQGTAPTPVYRWTTLAGRASVGSEDGPAAEARFNNPHGLAMDLAGNIYVADTGNHTIRKISPAGVVSTFAGMTQESGSTNGTGSAARFNGPQGVAVDLNGNVYVADTGNHTIRKITPAGVVTTLAGQAGSKGMADGAPASALFDSPNRLTVDTHGNVYLSNNGVRKISASQVQTLPIPTQATDPDGKTVTVYTGICPAVDASGQLYFATSVPGEIMRSDSAGSATVFRNSLYGVYNSHSYYAYQYSGNAIFNDVSGNLFVAVSITAGFIVRLNNGIPMQTDGTLDLARTGNFTTHLGRPTAPLGLVLDRAGKWYYTRESDHAIMSETVPYAGTALPPEGLDGSGKSARLEGADYLTADVSGNVWVAEAPQKYFYETTTDGMLYSTKLRKIAPGGMVTTPLQPWLPAPSGPSSTYMYRYPAGISSDASGNVYLAKRAGFPSNLAFELYEATPDATISFLGATQQGNVNVLGLASNASGKLLTLNFITVSYPNLHAYYQLQYRQSDGTWTNLAGGDSSEIKDGTGENARFKHPYSLTTDRQGNFFVLDAASNTYPSPVEFYIREISSTGTVTTVSKKLTGTPSGLAVDSQGTFYLTHSDLGTITKIDANGDEVIIGGMAGKIGSTDGNGDQARFTNPDSIIVDAQDNLYLIDGFGTTVRKGEYLGNTPGIVTQPQSLTVADGGNVQFTVVASSPTATTYQWYFNGNPFAGATSNTLSFTNARIADAGDYTVTVTNAIGSITSNKATLTVSAASAPATTPTPAPAAGGGGSLEAWFALGLLALLPIRRWLKNSAVA